GLTRAAVTNETGGYTIQLLPVGAYEITTELAGFKQQVRRGINLVVGQEAIVNVTLEVGTVSETVTVTGEAPIVNTTLSSTPGVDAVREFNLLQHSYGAEYGKRAGGHVVTVASSGTNQLHGSVFEYLRNSALDARNFFDATDAAPPFKRNEFGASLGGPIKKDKMFLFGNYEGFRQRLALSSVAVVPDLQMRQGLLPCYLAPPTACGSTPGQYVTVPNLKTGMLPYASNFWPAPNGNELLVAPGLQNAGLPTGTAKAIGNPKQALREDFGLTRFDYNVSNQDSFSVNYLISDGDRT